MAINQRRTIKDFAQQMRWLVDEAYLDVPVVRLVLDNLNSQSSHGIPVRGLPASGSSAYCQAAGVPLHAQARQLEKILLLFSGT